jgi:choline-sulfatase
MALEQKRRKKPNVLFIMDDQHRFDYVGYGGAEFLRTPNLDRLARRGVVFTNCFTNCPLCAPARISLATGLQPARLGLDSNSQVLDPQYPTLYQRFRNNGYRVHCVGKLDLKKPDPYNGRYGDRPDAYRWGFTHPEECEGKMHAGSSPTPIGPYTFYLEQLGLLKTFHEDYRKRLRTGGIEDWYRDSVLPAEAFEDCYIGRKAVKWIEEVPDDFPWFSFVSFVGPHNPFDPPAAYADKYRNAQVPDAIDDSLDGKPEWVKKRKVPIDPRQIRETRRQYCAAIEVIDDQIGLILDALDRRGMTDDTIIVFTSDHGEMLGDHRLYTKSLPYEPSIHVPLIVAGPGIEGGRVSDALIELIDLNPTVGDLAGVTLDAEMDALSFAPILRREREAHRTEIASSGKHFRCIRDGRYKLIENDQDVTELYDLEQDPEELHNIAASRPDLVRSLGARLRERFAFDAAR